ncbi:MAG: UDP-3-O-[3-hydroxymyristoyl] N-acetylglucosamine deacetylase [Planctomycetaceae bacterium]|nr:UDP-3-O-[3-hydroxymyristoyl] N-acetylglucosamine deacetylase [Planctomycetaceae bacterium]
MSEKQRTLAGSFTVTGTGLHEGKPARVTVKPAPENSGFTFVRVDLPNKPSIPYHPKYIGPEQRRTQIVKDGTEVHTCEHLVAGLYGAGIDNALIEIDGQEPPACDGSALDYAQKATESGSVEQAASRRMIAIREPATFTDKDASITLEPANGGLTIGYTLDYRVPFIPVTRVEHHWTPQSFVKEIAGARTFCLEQEVAALRAMGFGKGATTQNTLVASPKGPIENTLRWPDEYARHKVLDLIGDMALAGVRVTGRIIALKSGHRLNQKLAAHLLEGYERQSMTDQTPSPKPQDIQGVFALAPHRYPFLMIDRIVEISADGTTAIGLKNVTINEPYFQGHFPGKPVMPGVLQIEAMAQLGGLCVKQTADFGDKIGVLTAVDDARFKRAVIPGDQLRIEAKILRNRRGLVEMECSCSVDGEIASSATIKFMMVPGDGLGQQANG